MMTVQNATEVTEQVKTLRQLFPDWTIVYLPTSLPITSGILAVREQPHADYTKAADFIFCQGSMTTLTGLVGVMRHMESRYQEAQIGKYPALAGRHKTQSTLATLLSVLWQWLARAR